MNELVSKENEQHFHLVEIIVTDQQQGRCYTE